MLLVQNLNQGVPEWRGGTQGGGGKEMISNDESISYQEENIYNP